MNTKPNTPQQLPTISDCNSCGICCLNMGYPSYVTTAHSETGQAGSDINEQAWVDMPESLKQELLLYIQNYQAPPKGELDGPCVWYDAARRCCKHHEHRPQVCRDFSVGGKGCLEWRSHYRLHHPEYLP
ncbi:YkgJ family cysteine cluster protein [bacterium]|nr:YkgJ family cysteine cluster protein [bacterium]